MMFRFLGRLLMLGVLGVSAAVGQSAAAPGQKPMATDADPAFDVATIKLDPSGYPGMLGLGQNGRNFSARNVSLVDLIAFAYGVHPKQVVDAPKWGTSERYDIAGVPDKEGVPNILQQRAMLIKLLADRFKLTLRSDKQEMSAFVLTVTKDGPKLTPTTIAGVVPTSGMHPASEGWVLSTHCASTKVLAGFLQLAILDRPVVDNTGLTGRYDIDLLFTPDSSQFNGHPPPVRETANPAPGLFDALQQQLGLKLTSEKTQVEVYTIEKAEKPSEN